MPDHDFQITPAECRLIAWLARYMPRALLGAADLVPLRWFAELDEYDRTPESRALRRQIEALLSGDLPQQ